MFVHMLTCDAYSLLEIRWDDDFEENIPDVIPQPKTRHQASLPPLPPLPTRPPNLVAKDVNPPLIVTSIERESDVWDDDFDVPTIDARASNNGGRDTPMSTMSKFCQPAAHITAY